MPKFYPESLIVLESSVLPSCNFLLQRGVPSKSEIKLWYYYLCGAPTCTPGPSCILRSQMTGANTVVFTVKRLPFSLPLTGVKCGSSSWNYPVLYVFLLLNCPTQRTGGIIIILVGENRPFLGLSGWLEPQEGLNLRSQEIQRKISKIFKNFELRFNNYAYPAEISNAGTIELYVKPQIEIAALRSAIPGEALQVIYYTIDPQICVEDKTKAVGLDGQTLCSLYWHD